MICCGDDAPWDGDAAVELAESWCGADDDTEPASADVPAAGGYVNAGELVAAQLPERLWSGYAASAATMGRIAASLRAAIAFSAEVSVSTIQNHADVAQAINEFDGQDQDCYTVVMQARQGHR